MSTKIALRGNPLSTNSIYKSVCRGRFPSVYLTTKGKDLKEEYRKQATKQFKKRKPFKGDLEVWVTIYFGTKRRADWDNFHKLSMDALSKIVWDDDSQIIEAHVSKRYDKKDPRIEIDILVIE